MSTKAHPAIPEDVDNDVEKFTTKTQMRKKKDPLYIVIFYRLSLCLSICGFGCAVWGYLIMITAPFNNESRREGQETNLLGMNTVISLLAHNGTNLQGMNPVTSLLAHNGTNLLGMSTVISLLALNVIWTQLNLFLALLGRQNSIWRLNMVYDFFIWAFLVAFGVANMVEALMDRRMCGGIDRALEQKVWEACDAARFKFLVVELVAVNLGYLTAMLHFILLVARCCTQGWDDVDRSWKLRDRIEEEESILLRSKEENNRLLKQS